jgi:hypothetical protein
VLFTHLLLQVLDARPLLHSLGFDLLLVEFRS